MSLERIKEKFGRLPRSGKFIGIGSAVLAVSTIMPWYADLDSYRIGDQFLGITGPASFVGIVVLLLAVFSFGLFVYHVSDRHIPRLPVREAIVHLFVAAEAIFLLVLVNSIYFHPKFGVNITLKESRFGMTIAFIGAIVLFVGAYMQNKSETAKDSEMGRLEPLIKIQPEVHAEESKSAPVIKSSGAGQPSVEHRSHAPVATRKPMTPMQQRETPRPFLFGERPAATAGVAKQAPKEEPAQKEGPPDDSGSYMLRMDL